MYVSTKFDILAKELPYLADLDFRRRMATFELYRRSTIGMCLTETLDEMVQNGTLSPELAIQVLVQFDKVQPKLFEDVVYFGFVFRI